MSKNYVIKFAGLAEGTHKYEYQISKTFLEEFDIEDICDVDLYLKLSLEKKERMLTFLFDIKGSIVVLCDKCLEPLTVPMSINQTYYVKFGESYEELDENMCVIPETEHSFDLSDLIYDYIMLYKPMRCVHGEVDGSDEVCELDIPDLLEVPEFAEETETDPRWDVLKQIKFD